MGCCGVICNFQSLIKFYLTVTIILLVLQVCFINCCRHAWLAAVDSYDSFTVMANESKNANLICIILYSKEYLHRKISFFNSSMFQIVVVTMFFALRPLVTVLIADTLKSHTVNAYGRL